MIKDMTPGQDNVEFTAIIISVTVGKTNGPNKTNYLNITLQDKSGMIDAKLWNATDIQIEKFKQGQLVKGKGDIIKYNTQKQMKIVKLYPIDTTVEESLKYLPGAPIDADIMYQDLIDTLDHMQNNNYKNIALSLLEEHKDAFMTYPAATRNHHITTSGLLYHTYTMLQVGKSLSTIYKNIDKDLLYTGIILHDIGKVIEFSSSITPTYSLKGNLLGHISISNTLISNKAQELSINEDDIIYLQHLILAHHGKLEFGSPVLPKLKEAELLNIIDNMDARMDMFDMVLDSIEEGEFSKRIFALENRSIYKREL